MNESTAIYAPWREPIQMGAPIPIRQAEPLTTAEMISHIWLLGTDEQRAVLERIVRQANEEIARLDALVAEVP